jgi:ribonuclease HI
MPKEKKHRKRYVVFKGVMPGIYDTWEECQANVKGFPGASFASFKSASESEQAYSVGNLKKWRDMEGSLKKDRWMHSDVMRDGPCLAVDAACSGFPGPVEYRGVMLPSMAEAFRFGPFRNGSNNIGEFLAIVNGMKWLEDRSIMIPIYSDSKCAMGWVSGKGVCNTTMEPESQGPEIRAEIAKAESWLRGPSATKYIKMLRKWDTEELGEIPADFGNK